jgi:hypothetical protein
MLKRLQKMQGLTAQTAKQWQMAVPFSSYLPACFAAHFVSLMPFPPFDPDTLMEIRISACWGSQDQRQPPLLLLYLLLCPQTR